jgi:hypothetical protein
VKLGNDTIVVVTRQQTGIDRYHNPVMQDVYTEVRWCSVTPSASTEPGDQSAPRLQGLDLLAPPSTVMDSTSRVIFPATATQGDPPWTGPRYEVDGDVGQWGTAVQAHLVRSH